MALQEKCSSSIDLNYPYLLSKETILQLLKLRGINQPGIDSFDKNVLVSVYNRYILPLPQRKYRTNRRGREMTNKQIILAKTSKTPSDAEIKKNTAEAAAIEKTFPRFMSPYTPSTDSASPVKPPQSCINFQRKTIKLNSHSSTTSQDTSILPKNCNNGNKSSAEFHSTNDTEANDKTENPLDSDGEIKNTVESKRPAEGDEKDCPEPCKKKKIIPRITWP